VQRIDAHSFLLSLQGQVVPTLTGRPNCVLRLEGDRAIVATNRSPDGRPVPVEWIQAALDRLVEEGVVDISVESVGYRSAFVGAVLAQVPGAIAGQGSVRLPVRDATE